ncbi:MAG: hypothetical protein GIW99_02660 [Candidatus Eremiobacteraeota bacterium]|nr:hypothetical protein [Candidatus Eremiobacteraeota bacterium]MBC5826576.1 hypothetical protein [Candidatus Eremiobacteraeota bacterium]
MKTLVLIVGLSLLLAGCSSVKNERFTATNHDQVMTDIGKAKNLSDDDKATVLGGVMRSALGGYQLDGKTVGQVIQDQKDFAAQESAKAAAQKRADAIEQAKAQAAQTAMQQAVAILFAGKAPARRDINEYTYRAVIAVNVVIENHGQKPVRALKGTLTFNNLLGDKIIDTPLTFEHVIAPGAKVNDVVDVPDSDYDDSSSKFKAARMSDIKMVWSPEMVLFGDGSTIAAPSPTP